MQEIIVATNNQGKMEEIRALCADLPVILRSLQDIWPQKPEIPETGLTFEDNALIKASWVFERKNTWTIADDSGLEVDALQGQPGVQSARYAGEKSTYAAIIAKLLDNLKNVPARLRTARFRCVIAFKRPLLPAVIVQGMCEGTIGFEPRGTNGFGYDPVFIPAGYTQTFAELSLAQKNTISHRAKALHRLKDVLYESFEQK